MSDNDLVEQELEKMLSDVRNHISLNCIAREQAAESGQPHMRSVLEVGLKALFLKEFELVATLEQFKECEHNQEFHLLPQEKHTLH